MASCLLGLAGCGDANAPKSAICGDGVIAAGEECDDGNRAEHDGCSASCKRESQDCAGTAGGAAKRDACGICSGGTTGVLACEATCSQQHGGAFIDHCGQCVGGDTGLPECAKDCHGDWGGSASIDGCGTCAGGKTGVAACAIDCAGKAGGGASKDHCGQCVGGSTGRTACAQDCAGVWGGSAHRDQCSACVDGTTGKSACVEDCTGTWGGTAYIDHCGSCAGGAFGAPPCQQDCTGTWGGSAVIDHCQVCSGGTTGRTACVQDCNGTWGGSAHRDNCNVCVGGDTGRTSCAQDCNGTWGGTATLDGCGQCVGGTTGKTACAQDCNGDLGGSAHRDNCGRCVEGATGQTACQQDCAGKWGGSATTDSCGRCVGDGTGRQACQNAICILGQGETIASLVANPACDVVELPAGSYPLKMTFSDATMGAKQHVELRGAGKDSTTLTGVSAMVNVQAGRAVDLRDLKVTGALIGAAIINQGQLGLHGVEVSGNRSSSQGAGVHNEGVATIEGSLIADNEVDSASQAAGAGIYNLGGQLDVRDSIIRNNRLAGFGNNGAGLYNLSGKVHLSNVDVDGNSIAFDKVHLGGSDQGAGIYSANGEIVGQTVHVVHNSIATTNSRAEGAGIAVVGALLELSSDSTVDDNSGTGASSASGGGLFADHPTALHVAGASFSRNSINGSQSARGGAIAVLRGSLELTGNALDDNAVVSGQSSISGSAAVLIREGQLSAKSCSMKRNRVEGGDVQGGLVSVDDMTSPSEADEALFLDDIQATDNHVTTTTTVTGGLFYANDVLVIGHSTFAQNVIDVSGPAGSSTGNGRVSGGLAATRRLHPGRTSLDTLEVRDNRIVLGSRFQTNGGLFLVDEFHGDQRLDNSVAIARVHVIGNLIQSTRPIWLTGGLFDLEQISDVLVDSCDLRDNVIAPETRDMPPFSDATVIAGGLFQQTVVAGADTQARASRSFKIVSSNLSGNRIGNAMGTMRVDGGLLYFYMLSAARVDFTFGAVSSTLFDNAAAAQGTQATLLEIFSGESAAAKMELANVTIAKNQASGRFGVVSDQSVSQTPLDLTLLLANSVVLGNQPGDPKQTCLITGTHASLISAGYNLLDGGACPDLQRQPSDGIATLDDLGAYGDHGGASYTVAIDRAPALDGGNPTGCSFQGAAILTDQRGLPRTQGGRCDIGAFEQQP